MTNDEELPERDRRANASLVDEACAGTGSIRARRKVLFNQLSKRVCAEFWAWGYSYLPDGEEKPTILDWNTGGTSWIGSRIAWNFRVFNRAKKQPPENIQLAQLTREGKHFTRRFTDLVGQNRWRSGPEVIRFVKKSKLGHHVYSLFPLKRSENRIYITGVALFRPAGKDDFSSRECQIIHNVIRGGLLLLIEGLTNAYEHEIPRLTPRLYRIFPFLVEGFTEEQLKAEGYFDIEECAREIYTIFKVSGQAELIAKLAGSDVDGLLP